MTAHSSLYWLGLSLTIVGILMTALGVHLTRRRFTHRRGVWGNVSIATRWVGRRFRKNSEPVVISAGGAVGASATMTGRAKIAFGPTTPMDQKVEWLLAEVADIRSQLEQVGTEIRHEEERRLAGDSAEIAIRERQFEAVSGKIEGLAGDLLWVSAVGVILLITGQLLTAF
jgi:hypothetical protein